LTTGTNGNDDLHNDPNQNPETINALDGDDSITIDSPLPVMFGEYQVSVDGGNGFDTLTFSTLGLIRAGSTNTSFIARESSNQIATISYVNVERLVLTGRWWGEAPWTFGGTTEDWLTFTGTTGGKMTVNTGDGDDRVTLTGMTVGGTIDLGSGNDRVDLSASEPTSSPFFRVYGGTGNDDLTGSSIGDTLDGGDGNDILNGGGGNDHLYAGLGDDQLAGGTGDDRYYVLSGSQSNAGTDTIIELANEGLDVVYVQEGPTLVPGPTPANFYVLNAGAHVEILSTAFVNSVAAFHLTGNELGNRIQGNNGYNRLLGEGGDDRLIGYAGNDILDGGAGLDVLDGGTGDDRLYVDEGDLMVERANEGLDVVYARTDYVLNAGAHIETLLAVSAAATDSIDLTGNELNNGLQGNAGANILLGGGGNDTLRGLDGSDVLDGGAGSDRYLGGAGADTFRFSAVGDSPYGNSPDRILDFVSGTDKIDLSLIDANSNTAGDDGFTFIGTGAFTGVAGQLRYETVSGEIRLYGDVNGDGAADLYIVVNGTTISGSDFIV
jgi:Ca2+-binding RTX toxin-like protein